MKLSLALRGLKIGLLAGASYWFADTMVMFAVLVWKMGSPSSGLVPESFWLLVASLGIYGTLGALAGLISGALFNGLPPGPEAGWTRFKARPAVQRLLRRGPLKPLADMDGLVFLVLLASLVPMHALVLRVSPEVDDIMAVGFLTLHLGVAVFVMLGLLYRSSRVAFGVVVLLMAGAWVAFQDRGQLSSWRGAEASADLPAPRSPGMPNIVWFVADTTRADHLSAYGYPRDTTPFLEEAARRGVRFTSAYATAPWTLASHAGMFSGMYSARHHATHETLFLSFEHSTLAEALEKAGYRTLLLAGNPWLQDFTGLAQGYQTVLPSWRAYTIAQVFVLGRAYEEWLEDEQDKGARSSNQAARRWLERHKGDGRPFFWFFNYLEPHAPYHQIPDAHAMRYQADGVTLEEVDQVSRNIMSDMMFSTGYRADARSLEIALATYDGGIRYTDEKVREVVEMIRAAGLEQDTLFVFAADHGELFGKDGIWGHELSLDEALVHVPLLMWGKGIEAGGMVVTSPVQLNDVYATLLDVLGATELRPDGVQGASLLPTLTGAGDPNRPVFAEYYTPSHPSLLTTAQQLGMDPKDLRIRSVKVGPLKYVAGPSGRRALFDLSTDPEERTNLLDSRPQEASALGAMLERFVAESESGVKAGGSGAPEMDEATRARLCALGYMECE